MILRTDIPDTATQLANRRHALSMMNEIPDMWEYVDEWRKLAADFRAIGYVSNAERCDAKATHYAAQAGPRPVKIPPLPIQRVRTLHCEKCNDWTPHQLNITEDEYFCACGESWDVRRMIADELLEETANSL